MICAVWTVLAPGTNVMRHERTTVNDGNQSLHHHHYLHHHHHYQQQQLDGVQAAASGQTYSQGVVSGKTESAFTQLYQGAETFNIHKRATATASGTSASFTKAAASNWTMKAVDERVASHYSATQFETSDRRVTNATYPLSSPSRVLPAVNRQQAEIPFVLPTAGTSAASAEVRKPRPRPAVAVIELSSHATDDRIVYHEPLNRQARGRQDVTTTTSTWHSSGTLDPDVPGLQVSSIGVVRPYRSDDQATANRPSASDSWRRRKARKSAERRAAEQQIYRQT